MREAARIGLFLWALYLLSFGGGPHSPDEIGQLAATASLVRRGSFDANELFWMIPAAGDRSDAQVEVGPSGDVWSVRGPTVPILMAPWHVLGLTVPELDVTFTTLLSAGLITAVTGALVVLAGGGRAGGLIFGVASMAWPYSRLGFGEPAIGMFTVLAVLVGPLGWLGAAGAGLAVAAAAGAKWSAAALALPVGLYVLSWRRFAPVLAFGVAFALGMALLAWHNLARFGSPLSTGYELAGRELYSTDPLYGLVGLLASPYRGLIWFWPAALAVLIALPGAWRRAPRVVAVAFGVLAVTIATFAGWRMWWGGNAWGPRFLVPALPLLALVVPLGWASLGRVARAVAVGLIALSALVQLPGVLVDFNPFERALRGPLPDFPRAGSLFDPRAAQVVEHMRRLVEEWPCSFDLVWARCGAVDWVLVGTLVGALAVAAAALVLRRGWLDIAAALAVVAALTGLLVRGPVEPGGAWAELLAAARARDEQARPGDGLLVLASPEIPALWAHDRWRGAVYGLNRDDVPRSAEAERMLTLAVERHARLWLIASNVPRDEPLNGVDAWLDARAFPVEERAFGGSRLRLFLIGPPPSQGAAAAIAILGDGRLELIGTRVLDGRVSREEPARVELIWRGAPDAVAGVSAFVHLYASGRLVGQADAPLPATGVGRYAPRLLEAAEGELTLEVGLYRAATGERLAARRPDGSRFEGDRVPVSRLVASAGRRARRRPRAPSRPGRASTRR